MTKYERRQQQLEKDAAANFAFYAADGPVETLLGSSPMFDSIEVVRPNEAPKRTLLEVTYSYEWTPDEGSPDCPVCEKRSAEQTPRRSPAPREAPAPSRPGAPGLGRTHAAPAACVRTRPHPAIRVPPLEDDSEGSNWSTSIQSTGCTRMFSARRAGNIRSDLADWISRTRSDSQPRSAISRRHEWPILSRTRSGWRARCARYPRWTALSAR